MKLHTLRRTASAAVVGSVAFAGLMAVAPGANAAVEHGSLFAYGYQGYDDDVCTGTPVPNEPDELTFLDNGGPFTQTVSESTRITNDDNAADVSTVATSATITGKATPIGAGAANIDVSLGTSVQVTRAAGSACEAGGSAQAAAGFDFTLPAPMWLTISGAGAGAGANGYAGVGYADQDDALASVTAGPRVSGSAVAYLPAGKYQFFSGSDISIGASRTSASFSGHFVVSLTPVGAGAAPVGTGKRFATLGERSCATNSVPVSIKKAAKNKAKSVVLTVNNKKRATFTQNAKPKKRLKARTAVLGGIAPAAPATVSAVVTLKNGKKVTVSRTYLPCS